VAVVVWGASPVATKLAIADLPPLSVAVLRTLIGGAVALALVAGARLPLPTTGPKLRLLLLSGFCGFVAFPVVFSYGIPLTSAVHAAMILAMLPVITAAIAMAWDRRRPHRSFWIGCLVALVGQAVLVAARAHGAGGHGSALGDGIVLVSDVFASTGYVAGARLQQTGYPARAVTFWGVIAGSVLLLPLAPFVLLGAAGPDWSAVTAWGWIGVIYLALGVTILGYMLWYWALGNGGIARTGLFQFLQPVSGVLLAWLLLGERLTPGLIAATALILSGVWLARRAAGN
jgi:drug/metabolite transporter (DMT)-like permease